MSRSPTAAAPRGELPAAADANTIIEALIGPLWIRLLLTGETIDESAADRVADLVAAGAGAAEFPGETHPHERGSATG